MIHLMSTFFGDFDDNTMILNMMLQACYKNNQTVLKYIDHSFHPYGYSAVILLSESHFSIHTWPEKNLAQVDLFSCNPDLDAARKTIEIFAG